MESQFKIAQCNGLDFLTLIVEEMERRWYMRVLEWMSRSGQKMDRGGCEEEKRGTLGVSESFMSSRLGKGW
jgi:hypothetical protein